MNPTVGMACMVCSPDPGCDGSGMLYPCNSECGVYGMLCDFNHGYCVLYKSISKHEMSDYRSSLLLQ